MKGEDSEHGKENYYFRSAEVGGRIRTENPTRSEWLVLRVEMGPHRRKIIWYFTL